MTANLYDRVTATIIAAIEANPGSLIMPWHKTSAGLPANAVTGRDYNGSNILMLWIASDLASYPTATWATYKQWQGLGAQVRKGEVSTLIVKFGTWSPKSDAAPPQPRGPESGTTFARSYLKPAYVFNAAQVDGYTPPDVGLRSDRTITNEAMEAFVAACRADIRHGGQRAFYRPHSLDGGGDVIHLPDRALFTGSPTSTPTASYEAVRLHELAHWTGARHRLDRDLANRFDKHAYAAEELIAELASAYLCCELGITNDPRPDHAQYIAPYLALLRADPKAIITAASKASAAATYLKSFSQAASVPDCDREGVQCAA